MTRREDVMRAALERIMEGPHPAYLWAREALAAVDALPENDTEAWVVMLWSNHGSDPVAVCASEHAARIEAAARQERSNVMHAAVGPFGLARGGEPA